MLYKKIYYVGLAIYATMNTFSFGATYLAYTTNVQGCAAAGVDDRCVFLCDEQDWKNDFDCGNAGICDITCDQKQCLQGSTITASGSLQLNVISRDEEKCFKRAEFHLPDAGSANFSATVHSNDPFQEIIVNSGSNTKNIWINCAGGDQKDECKKMTVNAQTADFLYINVGGSELEGDANSRVSIHCPQNKISGPYGAPCYINAQNGASLQYVTIYTLYGMPHDLLIDADDTQNWLDVALTCSGINNNVQILNGTIHDCWSTRAPTSITNAPTTPTESPTRSPSDAPTLDPTNPTLNPTSPTKSPTQVTLSPTLTPTNPPTLDPTHPTLQPSDHPTAPTRAPTVGPSRMPSNPPTRAPSNAATLFPTINPTLVTSTPSNPTVSPTHVPSVFPTFTPPLSPVTEKPTEIPTQTPTWRVTEDEGSSSQSSRLDVWTTLLIIIVVLLFVVTVACVFLYKYWQPPEAPKDKEDHMHCIDLQPPNCVQATDEVDSETPCMEDEFVIDGDEEETLQMEGSMGDEADATNLEVRHEVVETISDVDLLNDIVKETPGGDFAPGRGEEVTEGCDDQMFIDAKNEEKRRLVKEWLAEKVELVQYYDILVENGYDSLSIIKEITNKSELEEIGIVMKGHQLKLMKEIGRLKDFFVD